MPSAHQQSWSHRQNEQSIIDEFRTKKAWFMSKVKSKKDFTVKGVKARTAMMIVEKRLHMKNMETSRNQVLRPPHIIAVFDTTLPRSVEVLLTKLTQCSFWKPNTFLHFSINLGIAGFWRNIYSITAQRLQTFSKFPCFRKIIAVITTSLVSRRLTVAFNPTSRFPTRVFTWPFALGSKTHPIWPHASFAIWRSDKVMHEW